MALRTMMTTKGLLKEAMGSLGCRLNCRWCSHVAHPAPLESVMERRVENSFALPEFDREKENNTRIDVPISSFGGSMELMAVPKKKVSKHKRGIRNGPRALKPIPVIMRCNPIQTRKSVSTGLGTFFPVDTSIKQSPPYPVEITAKKCPSLPSSRLSVAKVLWSS